MGLVARRFEVYLVNLDLSADHEIKKLRPCVVISPDEMNRHIQTIIVAPMTTKGQRYPTRVACKFQGKRGQIVLDRIRTIDRIRLVKRLGKLNGGPSADVLAVLGAMFAE